MAALDRDEQLKDWKYLYERIGVALSRFGSENAIAKGDYWIVDESNGYCHHKIYFNTLRMLELPVISGLQQLLDEFSDWEIVVAMYVPETGASWPEMGLIVRKHEIVDGLRREFFPPEYQSIEYQGSRPGTDRD
jgi:hypothetical protein